MEEQCLVFNLNIYSVHNATRVQYLAKKEFFPELHVVYWSI